MQRSLTRWVCLLAVLALVLAACSSGSSSSKKKTTTKPNPCAATGTSKQKLTVTPCQALTDGQTVKVVVSGFTTGKTVGTNECSEKTNDTGSGCDLGAIKPLPIDSKGGGSVDFTVKKGPFGQDNVKCGAPDQCLISVGELVNTAGAERTDTVNVNFAA
jgi:hypothetical protein